MYRKLKNRNLIIILAVLIVLTGIVVLTDSKKDSTFRSEFLKIDTSKVTSVIIENLRNDDPAIHLKKRNNNWYVKQDDKEYNANSQSIQSILSDLSSFRTYKVAARDKSQWGEFQVTDTSGSRVKVYGGKSLLGDFHMGRMEFHQNKNQQPQQYYMQRQQPTITCYMRLPDESDVYEVYGYFAMNFNQDLNQFRNSDIIKGDFNTWSKLTYKCPGDSSFVLEKAGLNWMVNGIVADSLAIVNHLRSISSTSSNSFVDDQQVSGTPDFKLNIEGANFLQPIVIEAYKADSVNKYLISSSLNEGVLFSGSNAGLFDKIFVGQDKFFMKEEN